MEKSIGFDKDLLDRVLSEIYNEEVKPSDGEIPQELFDATRDIFEQATAEGFANGNLDVKGNENYLKQYTHSVEVFSTFRVHTYAEMLASKLHDEEGNLRSFQEWKKETASIQSHFNENWLRTEYNTAILRAEQAADWRQFEKDKDIMPNLKWMPTSSATPREEHAVFWKQGLTLPVDDKFWDEHHPGDLWNCKCWLQQTDGPSTTKKEMPAKKEMPTPAKGLKSNPGKKAEMYDDSHPYYPDPKTCLWLRLAKQAKQSGAEAKLGSIVNAVKCVHNCHLCELIFKTKNPNNNSGPTMDKEYVVKAKEKITEAFDNWKKDGDSGCRLCPTKVGEVQDYIADYLGSKNIIVESRDIVISSKQLSHMMRDFKVGLGKAVELSDLMDFVDNMKSYKAVYDNTHSNFILYKYDKEGGIIKFAVDVNEPLKKYGKCNVVVTSGKVVDALSFWSMGYEIIEEH